MNIGLKIKQIRSDLGLKQDEFAKLINKSTISVKKYESNVGITVDLLQSIAEKLDVSMFSLFSDSTDLYSLFINIYNLNDLVPEEKERLKIEFNIFIEFLANKYNK